MKTAIMALTALTGVVRSQAEDKEIDETIVQCPALICADKDVKRMDKTLNLKPNECFKMTITSESEPIYARECFD